MIASPGFTEAEAAITAAFDAGWRVAGVLRTPVDWPGSVDFVPPEAAPWARLSIAWGSGFGVALGGPALRRWAGVVTVQVFHPRGVGTGALAALCDAAAAVFGEQRIAAGGLLRFWTPSVIAADEPGGRWLQRNVQCPFRRDRAATV